MKLKEYIAKFWKVNGGQTTARRHAVRFAAMALCASAMVSCSQDADLVEDDPTARDDYYYITLNVVTPTSPGTRADSQTTDQGASTDGELAGVANENALVSAHLYFCDKDLKEVLADFESEYVAPVDDKGNSFLRIRVSNLSDLEKLVGQEDVKILLVGNEKVSNGTLYTPSVNPDDISAGTFSVSSLTGDPNPIGDYGTAGKVLPLVSAEPLNIGKFKEAEDGVTTAEEIIRSLFTRLTPTNAWWDVNSTNTPVKLERAVARIEYRGAIKESTEVDGADAQTEKYLETHDYAIDKMEDVKLRLHSMTPFNVNNKSYLFRHTSPGTDQARGTDIEIFGKENGKTAEFTGYNWIASPWWSDGGQPTFINGLTNTDKAYLVNGVDLGVDPSNIKIADLIGRTPSEEIKLSGAKYSGGYHPWCYVSENTLYSQNLMEDEEVGKYATGVAFKFMVLDTEGKPITYDTHSSAQNFPLEIEWSREAGKERCLEITNLKTYDWVQIEEGKDGFYYLDYVAYIIHNYNAAGIGPMFYGVVRNNTYQISISKLAGLPHPNDPRKVYLELDINVLKWERRDVGYDF